MTDVAGLETGLLLVAHGERNATGGNRALLAHAARIAERWPHHLVQAGVLHGEPSLKQVLTAATQRGWRSFLLYAFFMAKGYIVKQMLAKHLREFAHLKYSVMAPLGLDPALPSLLLTESLSAARAAGFAPSRTRLLVVAHGSRRAAESATVVGGIADELRSHDIFASVETAYLAQQPLLRDALRSRRHPTVVVGAFAGEGVHACEDVPAALEAAKARATYTGPIGAHSEMARLVMNAFAGKLTRFFPGTGTISMQQPRESESRGFPLAHPEDGL